MSGKYRQRCREHQIETIDNYPRKAPKVSGCLYPVTALAFSCIATRILLLAGQGPFILIYAHATQKLLVRQKVFDSQSVHGITVSPSPGADETSQGKATVIIWGGRSVCCICITYSIVGDNEDHWDKPENILQVRFRVSEVVASDRILDACFMPKPFLSDQMVARMPDLVFVTAHNALLYLSIHDVLASQARSPYSISKLVSGPRAFLYSAHLVWLSTGCILVASGTVFGETLLWSFVPKKERPRLARYVLHYTLTGHEGSVFGVRISDETITSGYHVHRRILASCSDDRTIRVWDISKFQSAENTAGKAIAWASPVDVGHTSRIWGLRFLSNDMENQQLLSYGEDGTSQAWELNIHCEVTQSEPAQQAQLNVLHHCNRYCFHFGKNVWAAAVFPTKDGQLMVSTGGADGRIALFESPCQVRRFPDIYNSQWKIVDICKILGLEEREQISDSNFQPNAITFQSPIKSVFDALKGRWVIQRALKSSVPYYPCGVFKGFAFFEIRQTTDAAYDSEYLYNEKGDFITEQGFRLEGTRSYIYRYSSQSDTIDVWFVKADCRSQADYLFHVLEFQDKNHDVSGNEELKTSAMTAKGHHHCVDDDYWVEYTFGHKSPSFEDWKLIYTVKGPKKDYVSDAQYYREDDSYDPSLTKDSSSKWAQECHQEHDIVGNQQPILREQDSFKNYAWASGFDILASTEQGHVLLGTLRTSGPKKFGQHDFDAFPPLLDWKRIMQLDSLKSHCISTSVSHLGIVFLAGNEGSVFIFDLQSKSIRLLLKHPSKVSGIFAQEILDSNLRLVPSAFIGVVISCLTSTTVDFMIMELIRGNLDKSGGCITRSKKTLYLPDSFVVTSCHVEDAYNLLLLGSRSGALAIYDTLDHHLKFDSLLPCECVRNVHGEDALTVIKHVHMPDLEVKSNALYILTAGRNGKYAIHRLRFDRSGPKLDVELEMMHLSVPACGPLIVGAEFQPKSKDLLLWGFRGKYFVVWNDTQQKEITRIECGGAHRSWAYLAPTSVADGGKFIWTRASTCNIRSNLQTSHQVLQYGGHGREIKAVAVSPTSSNDQEGRPRWLIATGAEDTLIRLFSYEANQTFTCLGVLTKHTTGLQQLRWSRCGGFLFSAAGCEEFYAWRVQTHPNGNIWAVCIASSPPKTEMVDLRVMDFGLSEIYDVNTDDTGIDQFLISLVYADSSLRVYLLNPQSSSTEFQLLYEGHYTTRCLTQVLQMSFPSSAFLCTTATNGCMVFWPLTTPGGQGGLLSEGGLLYFSKNADAITRASVISWNHQTRIHQNSIKSITHIRLSPASFLVVTGGDDGAVAFTLVTLPIDPVKSIPSCSTLLIPNAHASAVGATAHLGPVTSARDQITNKWHRFATSSTDQKLKSWLIDVDLEKPGVEGVEVVKEWNRSSYVADIAAMETFEGIGDGKVSVVLAGIGMEVFPEIGEDVQEDCATKTNE